MSLSITLPLQPLTTFHQKIQLWPFAFFFLHIDPFDLSLPCAYLPLHILHLYYHLDNAPRTTLSLILLVLHSASVSTTAVSHRETCSIAACSFPFLKALFFQWFADPGSVTVDTECSEELLLG